MYFRTLSGWPIAKKDEILYNSSMPKNNNKTFQSTNVERDTRVFTWFLTLVMTTMFVFSLLEKPELRGGWQMVVFSALMVVHVILHWFLEKIITFSFKLIIVYILVQGVIGFFICWMAEIPAMIFAIFLALLGETVGLFGLKLPTLIASLYYLMLAFINLQMLIDIGESSWLLIGVIPVIIFVIMFVTLYQRQNEAREQALALARQLEEANQQLSQYADQVEDLTILNERQRMARELHDTLSQGLTGIILQLEAVEAHLSNQNIEKAEKIIANAMDQARFTLSEARDAIDDLRGNQSKDLESALRLEVSRFQNIANIACELEGKELSKIPETTSQIVMQNVKEALTNIARHARATHVKVQARNEDGFLVVMVEDDGQGFDPEQVPSGHYGLLGIRERLKMLGGMLDIHSIPGKGTILEMRIPQ